MQCNYGAEPGHCKFRDKGDDRLQNIISAKQNIVEERPDSGGQAAADRPQ